MKYIYIYLHAYIYTFLSLYFFIFIFFWFGSCLIFAADLMKIKNDLCMRIIFAIRSLRTRFSIGHNFIRNIL